VNLVIWLTLGGVMGCGASLLARTGSPHRIVMNIVSGVSGALVGGWILSPLVGASTMDQVEFSGVALAFAAAGAVSFLGASALAQREIAR